MLSFSAPDDIEIDKIGSKQQKILILNDDALEQEALLALLVHHFNLDEK